MSKLLLEFHQWRHSNQSHVPWNWLFFCPAPKVSTYFGRPITKTLKSPKWHWLILPPIGANEYNDRFTTYKQPNNPMSKAVEFGFLSIKVKTSSLQFGHCVRMGYGPKIKFTLIFIFCLFWRMAWLHYTKYKSILIKKQQSNFRLYMYIWLSIAIKQFFITCLPFHSSQAKFWKTKKVQFREAALFATKLTKKVDFSHLM